MKIGIIGANHTSITAITHALPEHEIVVIDESEVNGIVSDTNTFKISPHPLISELQKPYILNEFKKHRQGGNNRKKVKRKKARNGR